MPPKGEQFEGPSPDTSFDGAEMILVSPADIDVAGVRLVRPGKLSGHLSMLGAKVEQSLASDEAQPQEIAGAEMDSEALS